tara:strand:- start:1345 stop:1572 length:228 start_codon:yes stop_codon:yes gene_type:complete
MVNNNTPLPLPNLFNLSEYETDEEKINKKTIKKKPFLKCGEGKLCSDYHGITDFAIKRKAKIIKEQEAREKEYRQ